ncbi:MAG: zinc ribbon domain-containing protein, partial [Crocosphaera sp.]
MKCPFEDPRYIFLSICLDVNPKFTSPKCSHCGHIQKENRNKERFLCLNCGLFADADIQASVNIGIKGLEQNGSGKVKRNKNNYSLCVFPSGKQYNADLGASYNIGARYWYSV